MSYHLKITLPVKGHNAPEVKGLRDRNAGVQCFDYSKLRLLQLFSSIVRVVIKSKCTSSPLQQREWEA